MHTKMRREKNQYLRKIGSNDSFLSLSRYSTVDPQTKSNTFWYIYIEHHSAYTQQRSKHRTMRTDSFFPSIKISHEREKEREKKNTNRPAIRRSAEFISFFFLLVSIIVFFLVFGFLWVPSELIFNALHIHTWHIWCIAVCKYKIIIYLIHIVI